MADESQEIRGIHWREAFPFTHLFRAFRIAVHPSKLVLGLIALLSLYIGGRALDGIWPAKHLAVPGEVYAYEESKSVGTSSGEFISKRTHERDAIEAAYAQTLLDLGILKDRSAAEKAADEGDHLGRIKEELLRRRDVKREELTKAHDTGLETISKIQDRKEQARARRDVEEAYESAIRTAYKDAYNDLNAAEEIKGVGLFRAFFTYEAERVVGVVKGVARGNWLESSKDGRGPGVIDSILGFFTVGPLWLMRYHPVYFILFSLLYLTIWAIFGGAIARIAAVHVARDEKLSVRAALAFSLGKFLSFISAPLIPLVIVLVVCLVPLLAGFLSSLPIIGPIINIAMGLIFGLILAAGFVMTIVLLGTFGGFNLMYPTIAVEGSDSFDAISRSFSYVYARPWRMVFYTLVAVIYGALTYLFVRLFIWLMLSLTHHFVGAGMFAQAPSMEPLWQTMWRGPAAPPGRLSYDIDFLSLRWDQDLAAMLVAFWVYLVVGMLGAFAISFYFSANTIIYYLMRHEVDATELDDVYLEQSEDDFADATAAPVAAMASVAAVTTESPADPDTDGDSSAAT